MGVFGGVIIPSGTFADGYNISPSIGVEAYYPMDKNIDVVGDFSYTFLTLKNSGSLVSNENYYYLELSGGLRMNIVFPEGKFFINLLVGGYDFGVNYTANGTDYTSSSTSFGLSAGIGVIFPLTRKIELSAQGKFHNIFTPVNTTNYLGFNGGINYKF